MSFPLQTDRLTLRGFQDCDISIFTEYRSDPEVARYQSWDAPYPLAQATNLVKAMQASQLGTPGEWHQVAIELKGTHQLIGDCAFHIFDDAAQQAEIGYTLSRQHQGNGYATEAVARLLGYLFGELGLHRVIATCDVENPASSKLLERIGMRREAHYIENIWFNEKWGSEYQFALLHHEWKSDKVKKES